MKNRFNTPLLILLLVVAASVGVVLSRGKWPSGQASLQQKEADAGIEAASSGGMEMGPHMRMTALRRLQPGDVERAGEIAARARRSVEKYKDYRVALREGYRILLPDVPQKMYHFNHAAHYLEAERQFNVERPTSLLYEKTRDGYRLIGVMYTAPAGMTEDELNERVPLSVAAWHQHVNLCVRSNNPLEGLFDSSSQFGLNGSISTREKCESAGGHFFPQLLGWMIHLYPYEKTPQEMWSVERQMTTEMGHTH